MRIFVALVLSMVAVSSYAGIRDTIFKHYQLPDSVHATAFMAELLPKRPGNAGIAAAGVRLVLNNATKKIEFEFPVGAPVAAQGLDVTMRPGLATWSFAPYFQERYRLLLATAIDSTDKFVITSAYLYLPSTDQWKLIATCKINNTIASLQQPYMFFSRGTAQFNTAWVQTSKGQWLQYDSAIARKPLINPMPNVDSVRQYQLDRKKIRAAIAANTTTVQKDTLGVFYQIIQPGTGKSFTVADTVTVHYQLRIFGTDEIISGSATEAYTFPLKNLIKAWQIAVPLVKSGGKIKLVIPSGLGYSIRTRASKIPPNSILEFDVEVLDVKPRGL